MSTVWHGKYALSANVIHSLIKPLQEEDVFLCGLLRVICTDLPRCSSGCCRSILSAKETGRCRGEGNGFHWEQFAKEYLEVPVCRSFPVPPLQCGRQHEPGASPLRLLPGSQVCWRNTPAVLVGTHLSFPGCSGKHI